MMGILYNDRNTVSLRKQVFQIMLVFFFVYEVQPISVPDILTSRKLVFFLTGFLFLNRRAFKFPLQRRDSMFGWTVSNIFRLSIAMLIWEIVLIVFNHVGTPPVGESLLSRTILFIPFSALICLFMADQFDNLDQFMSALFCASILQAIIVLAEYFIDSFRMFLYYTFVLDANYGYLTKYRAAGLGAGESLLSMNLALGVFAGCYLLGNKKNVVTQSVGIVLILFAALLSGSTGFVAGLAVFGVTIAYQFFVERSFKGLFIVFFLGISLFGLIMVFPAFFNDIENFQTFNKISQLWTVGVKESSIVKTLNAQVVAPISAETIIGTSIFRGTSGMGVISRSDRGYYQCYFGYGLIVTIIYYYIIYYTILRNILIIGEKKNKLLFFMMLVVMAVGEMKEPYIHHYGNIFVILLACLLANRGKMRGIKYEENKCYYSNV